MRNALRHIVPGDVCQIGVSGNEKLRYIGGDICWVTTDGILSFNGITEWSDRITTGDLRKMVHTFTVEAARLLHTPLELSPHARTSTSEIQTPKEDH